MKKSLTVAVAALALGATVAATASPANAHEYDGGGYYGGHHHNGTGTALAAGAIGLVLGAAIASSNHGYARSGYSDRGDYDRSYNGGSYYGGDYYGGGYGYDRGYASGYYEPAYRVCEGSRWVWDPYIRRNVLVRSQYAC